MSLRKKAAIANFKFKWFDRMYDFLYSLNTYGDVVKFGVQFEKIVGRELLKEWRDFNKKKNKSKL